MQTEGRWRGPRFPVVSLVFPMRVLVRLARRPRRSDRPSRRSGLRGLLAQRAPVTMDGEGEAPGQTEDDHPEPDDHRPPIRGLAGHAVARLGTEVNHLAPLRRDVREAGETFAALLLGGAAPSGVARRGPAAKEGEGRREEQNARGRSHGDGSNTVGVARQHLSGGDAGLAHLSLPDLRLALGVEPGRAPPFDCYGRACGRARGRGTTVGAVAVRAGVVSLPALSQRTAQSRHSSVVPVSSNAAFIAG